MENTRADWTKGHGDAEHISRTSARPFTLNEKRKGREKGDKPVEHGERMTGRVVQIFYGQGHGFIRARDRRQLFFHRRDVAAAHFNTLAVGDGVSFEIIEDKLAGPRAVNVNRVVGKRCTR